MCNFPDLRLHYIYFTYTLCLSGLVAVNPLVLLLLVLSQ